MTPAEALELSTWVDHTSLTPAGAPPRLAVAFELRACRAAKRPDDDARPRARTVLAVDVSGSMKGEPLDHVIRSVDRILDALREDDELGVVAFSGDATNVVDPVRVDGAGKRLVRSSVARLRANGATNIQGGIELAASMCARPSEPGGAGEMRRGIVLLSDGAPNVGAHTAEELRDVVRRHRPHVSVFSLGYGIDHSEDVLSAIGDAGGGGYEYVPDPATCARAFARALGTQGDVVASGIELVVSPGAGVDLVRFLGREQTRFSRDGVVVSLPDMVHGASRLVVAELVVRAPGAERFAIDLVSATLRWRAPSASSSSAPRSLEARTTIEVADRPPRVVLEAARRVLLVRADEVREASRALGDRGQFAAAATGLRGLLKEIEGLEGFRPDDGSPLAEAYELLVDEAMAFGRQPSAEQYATFRKATAGARLASQVPVAAASRGDASQKLIEHVAGDCPPAWLVTVDGAHHALREEVVIGRTSAADIQIASGAVSRRQAEVFASAGDYWIADLGSTNPTLVNGKPLARAPHKLVPGDVVHVGGVDLRYEESRRFDR